VSGPSALPGSMGPCVPWSSGCCEGSCAVASSNTASPGFGVRRAGRACFARSRVAEGRFARPARRSASSCGRSGSRRRFSRPFRIATLERRRLSPARELGCGRRDEAVPRTPPRPPRRAPRDLGGARAQARRLDPSGLLLAHRQGDPLRGREGHRGLGVLPRPSALLTPEARLPRRPQGRALPRPYEPLAREKLRGHGPAGVVGPSRRPHPRPGPTSHPLLRPLRQSRPRPAAGRGRLGARGRSEPPPRRPCSSTWARLIAKVFQAHPLVCRRCGGPLKVVAYITDSAAIRQILQHLDISPPQKPPPSVTSFAFRWTRRAESSTSSPPELLGAIGPQPTRGVVYPASGGLADAVAVRVQAWSPAASANTLPRPAGGLEGASPPATRSPFGER
jgi:hypothetical protein